MKKYERLRISSNKAPTVKSVLEKIRNFSPEEILKKHEAYIPKRRGKIIGKWFVETSIQMNSQAERVITKFGGVNSLLRALKAINRPKNKTSVYRWLYPKELGGTGGLIPTSAWPDVLKAARYEGVFLNAEDQAAEDKPKIIQNYIAQSDEQGKPKLFLNSEERKVLREHEARKKRKLERRRLRRELIKSGQLIPRRKSNNISINLNAKKERK